MDHYRIPHGFEALGQDRSGMSLLLYNILNISSKLQNTIIVSDLVLTGPSVGCPSLGIRSAKANTPVYEIQMLVGEVLSPM